ncbi:hypothetical protein EJD97_014137, partial [Solanum chilense]
DEGTEQDIAPIKLAHDTLLVALFKPFAEPPSEPRMCTKRLRSSHTSKAGDEDRSRKRERNVVGHDKLASMVYEDLCQRSAVEMAIVASNSISVVDDRSTTDGAEGAVGTSKGEPSVDLMGFRKPDPPTC